MSSAEISQSRTLRRANDAFAGGVTPPRPLFGEFWREGELALLFGAAGTGKSLLAVQLAESLARGLRPDAPNAAGHVNRVVQGVTIYPWEERDEDVPGR